MRVIAYRPTLPAATWPKGAGAADLVGALAPGAGALLVGWLADDWSRPVPRTVAVPAPVARPTTATRRDDQLTAADLVARLERVRRSGDGWTARCPCPDHGKGRGDRAASLSVAERDGVLLVKCHAGCDFGAILAAVR